MKRICKQCGKEFELSESEIQFYKSKNLNIPKRCKRCRDKNKQSQQSQEKAKVQSDFANGKVKNTNHHRNNSFFTMIVVAVVIAAIGLFWMHQSREKIVQTNSNYTNEKTVRSSHDYFSEITASPSRKKSKKETALEDVDDSYSESDDVSFRNEELLNEHYQKHGKEMGFSSAKKYEKAAGKVVNNKKSLHKTEAEDGDDVYYLKNSNEFVIVSTDGYIRTYFKPENGIAYYNRQ